MSMTCVEVLNFICSFTKELKLCQEKSVLHTSETRCCKVQKSLPSLSASLDCYEKASLRNVLDEFIKSEPINSRYFKSL